eukprot:351645-Chlamydomonas_euryale.AAC.8
MAPHARSAALCRSADARCSPGVGQRERRTQHARGTRAAQASPQLRGRGISAPQPSRPSATRSNAAAQEGGGVAQRGRAALVAGGGTNPWGDVCRGCPSLHPLAAGVELKVAPSKRAAQVPLLLPSRRCRSSHCVRKLALHARRLLRDGACRQARLPFARASLRTHAGVGRVAAQTPSLVKVIVLTRYTRKRAISVMPRPYDLPPHAHGGPSARRRWVCHDMREPLARRSRRAL